MQKLILLSIAFVALVSKIGATEMQWAKQDAPEKMNWQEAMSYCEKLGEGWRLAKIVELAQISKNREKATGVQADYYWSATTYALFPTHAWVMNFDNGYKNHYSKTAKFNARCVRGVD